MVRIGEIVGWSIYTILGILMFYATVYPAIPDTINEKARWGNFITWIVGGVFCFWFTGMCIYADD